MELVSIRELKSRLSEYTRRAESGERFSVTRNGREVAVLGPREEKELSGNAAIMADLVARGIVRPPKMSWEEARRRWQQPVFRVSNRGRSIVEDIRADRDGLE